jgi:glycosyltransferase involved in cell wall biosynthesis
MPRAIYGWLRFLKPLDLVVLYFWYSGLVRKLKPDVLFPQSRYDQIVLTFIGRRSNIPVVWRDPGDLTPQLTFRLKNPLQKIMRAMQLWSIAHARHIITLNEHDRSTIVELVAKLDPARISVLGSNILFQDYSPLPKRQPSGTVTIGTMSRLDSHKGIQHLITAFNRISKTSSRTMRLVIAGDGPYRETLEKLSNGNPLITFIGNQEDVSDALNKLDIFVQPADFEGWGRNVREAMLFGLPVLGSDVGGIKDQIVDNQTGVLFKTGSSSDLERKLRRLLDDPALRLRLGQAARRYVLESGDWTTTLRDHIIPTIEHRLLSVRIDASVFLSESNLSGVGHYSRSLAETLPRYTSALQTTGPLNSNKLTGIGSFLDRVYRKLASYGLAPPYDLFKPPVDITIFPNFSSWPSVHSRLNATVIHDLTYLRYPKLVERKNLSHLRKVVPKAIERSDFIITVSEAVKQELVEQFSVNPQDVLVTHIPPDERFGRQDKTHIHSLYSIPTKKYILFIGNLEPRKNLERLVDSYLLLDETTRKHTSLVIAGGSGWRNKPFEKRLAKLAHSEHILSTGYIPDEHIPALYQQAAVFVLPSLYEGFGMGVLEAIASQTPVVAADIPALREAGGRLARYFEPTDTSDLASALVVSLKDPRIKKTDAEKHLATYSWDKNAQHIIEYCRSRLH